MVNTTSGRIVSPQLADVETDVKADLKFGATFGRPTKTKQLNITVKKHPCDGYFQVAAIAMFCIRVVPIPMLLKWRAPSHVASAVVFAPVATPFTPDLAVRRCAWANCRTVELEGLSLPHCLVYLGVSSSRVKLRNEKVSNISFSKCLSQRV